jgi:hypothetical protein
MDLAQANYRWRGLQYDSHLKVWESTEVFDFDEFQHNCLLSRSSKEICECTDP